MKMSQSQQSVGGRDAPGSENAQAAYQAAIDLWTYQGAQVWGTFNVMLVANSIIIAAIALFITSDHKPSPLILILFALPGFLLCILWFLLTQRANEYQTYYTLSARELEERYLSKSVKTVSRGGRFGEGDPVELQIAGGSIKQQMNGWARLLSAAKIANCVIVLFGLVYFVTFIL